MADIDDILNKYAPIESSSSDSPARSQPMSLLEDDVAAPVFLDADVTASTAGGRGLVQGLTAGFGDELAALATMDTRNRDVVGSYRSQRDAERATDNRAREQQGGAFLAGEIGGSILSSALPVGKVTGVRALTKLGQLGGLAARGAAGGAIYGAGTSEANTATGVLQDIGIGAVTGAGAAAVGHAAGKGIAKLAKGAQGRVDKRLVQRIVGDTNPSARNRLLGDGGQKAPAVTALIKSEPTLKRAAGKPGDLMEAANDVVRRMDDEIADMYRAIDATGEAIPVARLREKVAADVAQLRKAFRVEVADQIENSFDSRLKQLAGKETLTAAETRKLVGSLEELAFQGATVNPSVGKKMSRQFTMGLRDMLNEHVESAAKKHGLDIGDIRAANQKISTAINLRDVAMHAAKRAEGATKVSPFSMSNAQRLLNSPGAILAATASGQLPAYAAVRGGLAAGRGADKGLAALSRWAARNPDKVSRAELATRAARMGLSKTMANRIAELIAQRQGN